ncbi:iron-sulfur cluster carrier protein [Devosia pacifica]|uniref:Iron-sulfur cluster carrier protein n=1 Tax=Devosia pacifica TaxID=1335967 RepID=A0A918S6A6_9HYPH|nr:Mrp/NBP35 family ATP-binding protein [Devosia pacifica]GHA26453.1 iron-sulfur cluster carrier protein [Devosia pacifica]
MADSELAARIRSALGTIEIPGGGSLADYGGLSEIIVTPSAVAFAISVGKGMEAAFGPARDAAHKIAGEIAEGRKVMVSLTADRAPANSGGGQAPASGRGAPPARERVPGIRHIVAVGSGKGGVGKSTVAANFALAMRKAGLRVGLLDADLYGPSVPRLLGLEGKPAVREDGIFTPHEAHGIKAMSIGAMLEPGQAVVWRGPMATSALRQLLRETDWGELDLLVVDLPPGTGDIHISLLQQVPLSGAVIVSTPQELALIDARKAIDMIKRMQVPVLGIIENMSHFIAPDTGTRYDIFGTGGARQAAADLGVPFLGEIPLVMAIRELSDAGTPVVVSNPEGADAQAFSAIVATILEEAPALRPQ